MAKLFRLGLLLVIVFLSACQADGKVPRAASNTPQTSTSLPTAPADEERDLPPIAWAESVRGVLPLGRGSSCWMKTCTDYVESNNDFPIARVAVDEELTFRFGFRPSNVRLLIRGETRSSLALPAKAVTTWRDVKPGIVRVITSSANGRGDAVYLLRLRMTS